MKKVLFVSLIILMILLCSCQNPSVGSEEPSLPNTLTFTVEELHITLPFSFTKQYISGWDAAFAGTYEDMISYVQIARYDKAELSDNTTLYDVAKAVQVGNISLIPSSVTEEDGYQVFEAEFQNTSLDSKWKQIFIFTQSKDAYWAIAYACDLNDYDNYQSTFFEWTHLITFDE